MISLTLLLVLAGKANAAGRVALVIGNAAYKHAAVLNNPVNDANDLAAALEKQNFKVIKGVDLDHAGMLATIRKFSRALSKGDVGIFFYAGHGIQIRGKNYLVPTDAKLADSFGIDFELVRLERIHQAMEQSAKVNIIFLDACRNNPMARNLARTMGTRSTSVGNGLAAMESGIGSLISFSTQPGNVALDGRGMRNSPYSAALAKYIAEGDGDITEILIKVRRDVMSATSRKQVPWEHSALTQQFYFKSPSKTSIAPATPQSSSGSSAALTFEQRAELAYWNSVKDSGDAALLRSYLEQYPTGAFAALAKVMVARSGKVGNTGNASPDKQVSKATTAPQLKTAKTSDVAPSEATTLPAARSRILNLSADARRRRARLLRLNANRRAAERQRAAGNPQTDEAGHKTTRVAGLDATRSAKPAAAIGSTAVQDEAALRTKNYRVIQRELRRLKCYAGDVDGTWSARAHLALRRAYGSVQAPSVSEMRLLTETAAKLILTKLQEGELAPC